jgi:hypothetical protein
MTGKRTIDDLVRLTETVEDFCAWIESLPARDLRAQSWGAREVLAHLVFWHEYYCVQSRAAPAGKSSSLPAGRFTDINARAVEKYRALAPRALAARFRSVNRRLCRLAAASDPRKIAFRLKEDSQMWKLSELIPAVEAHIRNHRIKLGKRG